MTTSIEFVPGRIFTETEHYNLEVAYKQITTVFAELGKFLARVKDFFTGMIDRTEKKFERGYLLRVYRKRHAWKKADLPHLATYKLNKFAQSRIMKIAASQSLGRGTTIPYVGFIQCLSQVFMQFQEMLAPDTLPKRRLTLLKKSKLYPGIVEATYRGEYLRIKQQGLKRYSGMSISGQAEELVSEVFITSTATLKRLCAKIRRNIPNEANRIRPIKKREILVWLENGTLPETMFQ